MSIFTEIDRIQQAKESINIALSRKGIHIPSGSTIDEYAAIIDPITSGETMEWRDNPQNYLSFKFVTNGTVIWQNVKGDIEYSKNGGLTWTAFNNSTVSATTGDEIWFKGSLTGGCGASQESSCSKFYTSGKFYVSGNIQSLCSFNNTLQTYHFAFLFKGCSGLNIDNSKQLLLPATILALNCYQSMFQGCTSLTTAPEVPATTLANYCYVSMFQGCTSLTTAPELLATTLVDTCYTNMFQGCASLTTAPALLATTLANFCYQSMFQGCTSLTTAPELPATTLVSSCYSSMFKDCTSLTTAPELLATTLAPNCYASMFQGCASLTTAPVLSANTLASGCYSSMFYGCSNLNYIKAMFTTSPSPSYLNYWVYGVASSGTFVKNSAATWTSSCGSSTYPCNWTVQTASS